MTPLTPSEKQAAYRERKAKAGLKEVRVYVPRSGEAAVKALEQQLIERMQADTQPG